MTCKFRSFAIHSHSFFWHGVSSPCGLVVWSRSVKQGGVLLFVYKSESVKLFTWESTFTTWLKLIVSNERSQWSRVHPEGIPGSSSAKWKIYPKGIMWYIKWKVSMSSLAQVYSGVIECKIKKLLKEYRVTYQMEGRNESRDRIWFLFILLCWNYFQLI
jgi:hypothetical protein